MKPGRGVETGKAERPVYQLESSGNEVEMGLAA
jgi:hypothetical protein